MKVKYEYICVHMYKDTHVRKVQVLGESRIKKPIYFGAKIVEIHA